MAIAVPETWTPAIQEGVASKEIGVIPYDLSLDYDYWSYGNNSTPDRVV